MPSKRPWRQSIVAGVMGLLGCGLGTTDIVTPPPPPPTALTLTFTVDPDDRGSATALGWATGLPDLAVTIAPADSSAAPRNFRTDSAGSLRLTDLAPGTYVVEASRWLTPAERAILPAGDDAIGFIMRTRIGISQAGGPTSLIVPASRRRGLIISEWAFNIGDFSGGTEVLYNAGFLELYNNSDTTVYLDGMEVGQGLSQDYDYPNFPCANFRQYSEDPLGVWTLNYQVVPGHGRDYPVPPGSIVVIATDAIDHRPEFPQALDLSHADFEFSGSRDVDNPSVPNLINTGYDADLEGHGVDFVGLGSVAFIAAPIDETSLPLTRYPGTSQRLHTRIPKDRLLDVVAIRTNFVSTYNECARTVDRSFDRAGFRGRGTDEKIEALHSVERRAAPLLIAGRTVLQATRTSDVDFFRGSRTPGRIPDQP